MRVEKHSFSPPKLNDVAKILHSALENNYVTGSASVATCPDLRLPPFNLTTSGLSGSPVVADVGGQPNLFPRPVFDARWSLPDLAAAMEMSPDEGQLLGAGAGPHHIVGQNCELAAEISWADGFTKAQNGSYVAEIDKSTSAPRVRKSPSLNCALMINLFGSKGRTGPVLKISARGRKGEMGSLTECIQAALKKAYGDERTVSLGGVFLIKSGRANFHIMPDFPPPSKLPFADRKEVEKWLTYHDFDAPVICLAILHSADPGEKLGLRMEHTHCFAPDGRNIGGHYHFDLNSDEEVEYEGYFNVAETIYRIDRPVI